MLYMKQKEAAETRWFCILIVDQIYVDKKKVIYDYSNKFRLESDINVYKS